jgi:hypothetical protein
MAAVQKRIRKRLYSAPITPDVIAELARDADDAISSLHVRVTSLESSLPTHTINLGNISTKASDAAVLRFPSPIDGRVALFQSVLNAALATADATLTLAVNGTRAGSGVLRVGYSGSAAGDIATTSPTSSSAVRVGDLITVTCGGGSTATGTATVSITLAE